MLKEHLHPHYTWVPRTAIPCVRCLDIRIAHDYPFVHDHPGCQTLAKGTHLHCPWLSRTARILIAQGYFCGSVHLGWPLCAQGMHVSALHLITHLQMSMQDSHHSAQVLVSSFEQHHSCPGQLHHAMPGVVKQYSCMQAAHAQDFTLLLVTPLTEWVSRMATPCASFCVHPSCDGCPKRATPCARHVCMRIAHGYQFVNDHPRWPHHAHSCVRTLLRPCPTLGLIRLLRSHRSSTAQLRSCITYSGHGCAVIPPLSTTLGLIPIQSLLHLTVYPALM